MQPLIITASQPTSVGWHPTKWITPRRPKPSWTRRCAASRLGRRSSHTHAESRWQEVIALHRQKAGDLVLQCGMSACRFRSGWTSSPTTADMISMITSHHDEAFTGRDFHVLHPREELEGVHAAVQRV